MVDESTKRKRNHVVKLQDLAIRVKTGEITDPDAICNELKALSQEASKITNPLFGGDDK